MKKAFVISALCALLFLFLAGSALAQIVSGCARTADEATRLETARAVVTVNAANYESLINHWAEDVIYKEPVLTNSGRQEMLDYLAAVFGGTAYGFPDDKAVTINVRSNDITGGRTFAVASATDPAKPASTEPSLSERTL